LENAQHNVLSTAKSITSLLYLRQPLFRVKLYKMVLAAGVPLYPASAIELRIIRRSQLALGFNVVCRIAS
jgi:hypothetical protein